MSNERKLIEIIGNVPVRAAKIDAHDGEVWETDDGEQWHMIDGEAEDCHGGSAVPMLFDHDECARNSWLANRNATRVYPPADPVPPRKPQLGDLVVNVTGTAIGVVTPSGMATILDVAAPSAYREAPVLPTDTIIPAGTYRIAVLVDGAEVPGGDDTTEPVEPTDAQVAAAHVARYGVPPCCGDTESARNWLAAWRKAGRDPLAGGDAMSRRIITPRVTTRCPACGSLIEGMADCRMCLHWQTCADAAWCDLGRKRCHVDCFELHESCTGILKVRREGLPNSDEVTT